jgi:hypothetical protein
MRTRLGVALLLVVAVCKLCNGILEENFTNDNDAHSNQYVWTQTGVLQSTKGNGTASGMLPDGSSSIHWQPNGIQMRLDRGNPVAETVLLDWDGRNTNVTFGACIHRLDCLTTPGNMSLLWSNDSFVWQPLWNYTLPNPLRQWCQWSNVTVAVPVSAATPRFALDPTTWQPSLYA